MELEVIQEEDEGDEEATLVGSHVERYVSLELFVEVLADVQPNFTLRRRLGEPRRHA